MESRDTFPSKGTAGESVSEAAEDELAAETLELWVTVKHEWGIMTCRKCYVRVFPEAKRSWTAHFESHMTDRGMIERTRIRALHLASKLSNSEIPFPCVNGWKLGDPLVREALELKWVFARECKRCSLIVQCGEGIRKHMKRCGASFGDGTLCRVQSLNSARNGWKWFKIEEQRMPPDQWARYDGSDKGKEDLEKELARADALAKCRHLTGIKAAFDSFAFEADLGSTNQEVSRDERLRSHFVSITGCSKKLDLYELSLEKAIDLRKRKADSDSADLKVVFDSLEGFLEGLLDNACLVVDDHTVFSSVLSAVYCPGQNEKSGCFSFHPGSHPRYARHLSIVLVVLLRVYETGGVCGKFVLGKSVSKAVSDFWATFKRSGSTFFQKAAAEKEIVHVLRAVFFETEPGDMSKAGLFCELVANLLCVDCSGSGKFGNARSVRSSIAGICYGMSCVAILDVLKYCDRYNRSGRLEEYRRMLDPGMHYGYTALVELRAACIALCIYEEPSQNFFPCVIEGHGACGWTSGRHVSGGDLGIVIRAMQARVFSLFTRRIMFGHLIPPDIVAGLDGIIDNIYRTTVGYWAFADVENKGFISKCHKWMGSVIEAQESQYSSLAWYEDACDLLFTLIAVLHLVGGAPARGTEVGSYLTRNRADCPRSVYFPAAGEMMILQRYDKRRALMKGSLKLVSRHADTVTCKLFKMYFIFVWPLLQHQARVYRLEWKNLDKDLLSFGLVKPESISGKMASKWARDGLGLSFMEYRHHQCGLVKVHARNSGRTLSMDKTTHVFEAPENNEDIVENALYEQAGHTIKTAKTSYAFMMFSDAEKSDAISKNRAASSLWHEILGITSSDVFWSENKRLYHELDLAPEVIRELEARGYLTTKGRVELRSESLQLGVREKPCKLTGSNVDKSRADHAAEDAAKFTSRYAENGECGGVVSLDRRKYTSQTRGLESLAENESAGCAVASLCCERLSIPEEKEEEQRSPMQQFLYRGGMGGLERLPDLQSRHVTVGLHDMDDLSDAKRKSRMYDSCEQDEGCRSTIKRRVLNGSQQFTSAGVSKDATKVFNANDVLREMYGAGAKWLCDEQKLAMERVAARIEDLLIVLGTGQGKSATVIGPIRSEEGATIWISPFRALRRETMGRLLTYSCDVFDLDTFPRSNRNALYGAVLLIGPEDVCRPIFRAVLRELLVLNALNRVLFDEAHEIPISSNYRVHMTEIQGLSVELKGVPIVMLTATAPPGLVGFIARFCGSDETGREVRVIRSDPFRANIRYEVLASARVAAEAVWNLIAKRMQEIAVPSRIIVYSKYKTEVESLFEVLLAKYKTPAVQLLFCHGGLTREDMDKTVMEWNKCVESRWKVMLATNAFGCGVDQANVRSVVIIGGCYSLLDFVQQAGRAGRDNKKATVTVLYNEGALWVREPTSQFHKDLQLISGDFKSWAENRSQCRREGLRNLLLGNGGSESNCLARMRKSQSGHVERCDVCEIIGLNSKTAGNSDGHVAAPFDFGSRAKPISSRTGSIIAPIGRLSVVRKINEEKRRREVEDFRSKVGRLSRFCYYCLMKSISEAPHCRIESELLGDVLWRAGNCNRECDRRLAPRCRRCLQKNHSAVSCPVFNPVYFCLSCNALDNQLRIGLVCKNKNCRQSKPNKPFRCGECRMDKMRGIAVHKNDVGKNCSLSHGVRLAMLAISTPRVCDIVTRDPSPFYSECLGFRQLGESVHARYLHWLVEDNPGNGPGVGRMIDFMVHRFNLVV